MTTYCRQRVARQPFPLHFLAQPAACGKSTVVRVLKEALSGLAPEANGGRVETWDIFPKVGAGEDTCQDGKAGAS